MPAVAHESLPGCELLLSTAVSRDLQREVWRLERDGDSNSAAILRGHIERLLSAVKVETMIGFPIRQYSSRPKLAELAGGARAIFKTPLFLEAQSPYGEIAAVITNEELGFPMRIPVTVWRQEPEKGSLQLWIEPRRGNSPVDEKDSDLLIFDFIIDNFDRASSNILIDAEFGIIAIDNAAAYNDPFPLPDWSAMANWQFRCTDSLFEKKMECLEKLLSGWSAKARLDWREIIGQLDAERLARRLGPWVEPQIVRRAKVRFCVLKSFFSDRDYSRCRPLLKAAGFQ